MRKILLLVFLLLNITFFFAVSSVNIITGKNLKVSNLFDLNGRELLSSTKKKINLDQLPQGIYVLKTTFEDGTTTSHKILKK